MKNSTHVCRKLSLCLILIAGFLSSFSQQIEKGLTISTGERFGFLEYKPAEYDKDVTTKYPIIIFLHGIGERGNGTTDLHNVARNGIPRLISLGNKMRFTWNGKTETFIVLSPQCLPKYGMWPANFLDELVQYAKQNLRIDTNRIFMTGLSMGGGGTYRYISDGLPQYPYNLAAVATICAPCTFGTGKNVAASHLPVWSFHAQDDPTASVVCTQNAIKSINIWKPEVKPMVDYWATGGHIVWDRVYTDTSYKYQGIVNIYEWFLGQNKSFAINKLPVANAGADKIVSGTTIVLDGSASTDADGKLVRFVWKKISGPATGTIVAPMGTNASTTVKGIGALGKYTFELAAVDDRAAFTRDTVSFVVTSLATASPVPVKDTVASKPATDPVVTKPVKDTLVVTTPVKDTVVVTSPVKDTVIVPAAPASADSVKTNPTTGKGPVARAGQDIVLGIAWNGTLINGSLSTDNNGWFVKMKWTKVSGPSRYAILDSTAIKTYVSNLDTGVYVFRLTVTDTKGISASDDLMITVKAPAPPPVPVANIAPIARAGNDVQLSLSWNKTLINGSLSTDKDGWFSKWFWTKISGPSRYKIQDSMDIQTYVSDLDTGVYVFRLTVTDNKGASSTDDVTITVKTAIAPPPASDVPPVAYAGVDGTTSLGWNMNLLNCSGSTARNGWITSIKWTKVSGPAQYRFDDSSRQVTYVKDLVEGVYTFRVTIKDNHGDSSYDDVNITVMKRLETAVGASAILGSDAKLASTALNTAQEGAISIHPNPAVNSFQLQYASSARGQTSIIIYDLNGRVVKSVTTSKSQEVLVQSVNVNDLISGVYYAVAKTASKSYAPVKFIKQ